MFLSLLLALAERRHTYNQLIVSILSFFYSAFLLFPVEAAGFSQKSGNGTASAAHKTKDVF